MSTTGLWFSVLTTLILLLCCTKSCRAQNSSACIPSSCGDIEIRYPFRLRDNPTNCGHWDPVFVLECQQNRTLLRLSSRRYHVQAITYNNFSILVSDPGLDSKNYSSCPVYSSIDYDIYSGYMSLGYTNTTVLTFLNCLSPVNNPLYVESPFCGNKSAFSNTSRVHSYVTARSISVSDLEDSCTFDMPAMASLPASSSTDGNFSYSQIHDMLAYGVELSWYRAMCTSCEESKRTCFLEDNRIQCRRTCYESTPLSERDFGCKLEYYARGLIGLRFLLGIPFIIGFLVYKRKTRRASMNKSETIEEILKQQIHPVPINYSYSEIKKMTRNFKAKIGQGPHGTIFKGNLRSGPPAALKMLEISSTSDKEFITYVSKISRTSHENVVRLIGFCIEGKKRALVHEFMQHGSLDKHIFLQKTSPPLSCKDMFKISLGTARGIKSLHDNNILHLWIKPENILLDQDHNPKISDSGLQNLYTSNDHEAVSPETGRYKTGFLPPEMFYKNIGEVSYKADVYSYGMLVLEMAARTQALNPYAEKSGKVYFLWWIYKQLSEGKELETREGDEEERKMVKKMMIVGLWCIQIRPGDRPLMSEVVAMLEGGVELLKMPPMPFQGAMDDQSFSSF
ncbi:UNVERIFIED_CONTAM: LEAF RUST 10 DISEASE-RESISTANCE LOCUS RECEPTOR-LIKE PROTEIN KINASE-like 2.1 [Sesamum radiatum]|uniref:LEAF RUST 10 DISEASE-RESISTANCE LOCUS RECEPTOR-LIKE PROTEIN KINASE-like 2.1 n=1 Tax=Sesamum radiatum TaxID=300843 RepID=A0AAW2TE38_SESRA